MAARDGAQYLAGLRDGREIWFAGERVADVTAHPLLGRMARTLAALYDLQHDPAHAAELTYPSPSTGAPVSLAFIQPRGVDDLVRRRRMFERWADASGGMLGRTPDYLNAILAGCALARDHFARNGAAYAERIVAYYEQCRERDLCATHAFLDPQSNRARTQTEQADPTAPLHIVAETAEGLIVSGARTLATLAPYADELLVFPSTSRLQPSDALRYAFAFAIPIATPGLRFLCRQNLDAGAPPAKQPLAARFEEMDCVCVFHEVLVPWERVFLKGDIGLCNGLFRETPAFIHGVHQFTTKNLAKAEFVLGVASLLAEARGAGERDRAAPLLDEIARVVQTLRAYLLAAEAAAVRDAAGYVVPNPDIMTTARNYFPRQYPRLSEIVRQLAGPALLAVRAHVLGRASGSDGDVPSAPDDASGALYRLAWDLAGSSFAGRQVLYERFFGGDPNTLLAARFLGYDRRQIVARVQAMLASTDAAAAERAASESVAEANPRRR